MGEVISLDEHKPHLVVSVEGGAYVMPVAMIKDIISGKMSMYELEDCEIIIPAIIGEWLEMVGEEGT